MNDDTSGKAALRRRLRAELNNLSVAGRARASAAIGARLREHPAWRNARSILFFHPSADEPDIWPLAAEVLAAGKIVCLPRYAGTAEHYQPCRIDNLAGQLEAGHFGILEPTARCPKFPANQLDFVLVPGLGFSLVGGRLGRGKGFYDRLLAQVSGLKCGVAFEFQFAVEVPLEPHDIRVDCIVTPACWHEAARQARA